MSRFNDFFNLTISYKTDSDFRGSYWRNSRFDWKFNDNFKSNYNFSEKKEKIAFAAISNCIAKSQRLKIIDELKKYTQVDVYGKCGMTCPFGNVCKEKLYAKYKFYFAFENNFCQDYITEKFFLAIRQNIVPVVLGLGTYEHVV